MTFTSLKSHCLVDHGCSITIWEMNKWLHFVLHVFLFSVTCISFGLGKQLYVFFFFLVFSRINKHNVQDFINVVHLLTFPLPQRGRLILSSELM